MLIVNGRIYRPSADEEPQPDAPYERKAVDGVEHVTLGRERFWRVGKTHYNTRHYSREQAREAAG